MTGKADKALKNNIFKAIYKDNVELHDFELGKTQGSSQALGESKSTEFPLWLTIVLFLMLTGAGSGSYLFSTGKLAPILDSPVEVATNLAPEPIRKEEPQVAAVEDVTHHIDIPLSIPPLVAIQPPRIIVDAESLLPESLLKLIDTQIPLARLFDLQAHTIVIDPGHGGRDPGTIGPKTGLTEKEITLDVARMLKTKLEKDSRFRVLLTRDSDKYLSLKSRVAYAKEQQADLFVSIHVNSLPNESDNLVETFFFGAQKDSRIASLAEKENRGSEYALGDFAEMIQVLGDTLKTQESQHLATSVQSVLFSNMKQKNKRIRNAGIKTAPFVVLLGVEVPAILTEIACVSNNQEEKQLSRAGYRQEIANYLELGIREYLERRVSESTLAKGAEQNGIYQ